MSTVVCFHAHPDDEALYTGGTMARLAAEGHRVVLVTATAGEAGLAASALSQGTPLGERRAGELAASAKILGCARTVLLGYADSGMADAPTDHPDAFARVDPETAARRLADILVEEAADALTVYDAAGGYGHPDHIQVHRVGTRAAQLAATPVVAEATVDRRALQRAVRLVGWAARTTAELQPSHYATLYSPTGALTHRVDVRRHLGQKRAAMRAHASQATADGAGRTLAWFLRLPPPLFAVVFGREWFIEQGRTPAARPLDDLLASLRR